MQEKVLVQEQFNRRWRPALMAFFLRRVRDHAEAEDLTQEVFMRLLNSTTKAEKPDAFVFQVAQNLLIDRARQHQVRERHRLGALADDDRELDPLDPYRITEGRERVAALVAALSELPERTRTMFILYRIENMSQEAIGETYGISASAVKQQIAKAMAALAKKMRNSR